MKCVPINGLEIDAGSEVLPQHPLPLLVQAGLLVPQKLQQFSSWRIAFPIDKINGFMVHI